MVSAIFIIAVGLGTAFLLGLVKSDQKGFAFTLTVAALAVMTWIAYDWTVALSRGQGEIRLEVADNGPGIAEKDRERVTERFVRLEASRSQPGSGLGLSMAKAAMRFHGGRLA